MLALIQFGLTYQLYVSKPKLLISSIIKELIITNGSCCSYLTSFAIEVCACTSFGPLTRYSIVSCWRQVLYVGQLSISLSSDFFWLLSGVAHSDNLLVFTFPLLTIYYFSHALLYNIYDLMIGWIPLFTLCSSMIVLLNSIYPILVFHMQ